MTEISKAGRGEREAKNPGTGTGCKEIALHLRTAHFTLVLVCLALIATAVGPGDPEISLAKKQLREIESIIGGWTPDIVLGYMDGKARAATAGVPDLLTSETTGNLAFRMDTLWYSPPPPPDRAEPVYGLHRAPDDMPRDDWRGSAPPSTFARFRDIWDLSWRQSLMGVVSEIGDAYCDVNPGFRDLSGATKIDDAAWSRGAGADPVEAKLVKLIRSVPLRSGAVARHAISVPQREGTGCALMIPVGVRTIEVAPQSALMRPAPQNVWKLTPGLFKDVFPDLANLTANYPKYDWDELKDRIRIEEQRAGEQVEILNTKIPAARIGWLGIVVVTCIQLYLLMNLRTLLERIQPSDPAWGAPWVALYDGGISKGATYTTLLLAPLATNMLLSIRLLGLRGWIGTVMLGMVLVSAAIVFPTGRYLRRMAVLARTQLSVPRQAGNG